MKSTTMLPFSFKNTAFKKIFLVWVFLFFCSFAFGQDYKDITFRIDSLANIGLPKSALNEVSKLNQLARKNNNAPQIIRAVIYQITFQSYLEENALVPIIDTLKADIQRSGYPVKSVLQLLLANMYWKYYEQNRYQFTQRTKLDKPDADFTRWDLRTIIGETGKLYRLSLQDAVTEQNTPVDILDGVLTGDKATRNLRPTLYDLLVQRSFEFFLADEPALSKPKLPFSLNDPRFFQDSRAFSSLNIKTTDTASTWYRGIKFLQQATLFHLNKNDKEALADLDLKRLSFLYNKSSIAHKDSLYLKALNNIANTFADKPISADALYSIGTYYQQKDSLIAAFGYFKKAVDAYPNSIGGKNAVEGIKQLTAGLLMAHVENVNSPGKPLLALLDYKNVNQANTVLYKLSQEQLAQYKMLLQKDGYRRSVNAVLVDTDAVYKYLNNLKPLRNNTLNLPGTADYRKHSVEFKIDELQAGNYVLMVKDVSNAADLLQLVDFKVTGLACIARENPDDNVELRVMDRETGMPLNGVSVSLSGNRSRINRNLKQTVVDTAITGFTDRDGGFKTKYFNRSNISWKLILKGDTLVSGDNYISGQTYNDNEAAKKTLFFTDRQIYRPGQTIYFKGLKLSTLKRKSKILTGSSVQVEFKDANQKTITKQDFTTNDFGTFSGSFTIPQNILNGNVRLQTGDGDIEVSVEEYKRPTFNVEFSDLKESYHLNDSIRVKGKVIAFSGYGLSQAKVAYHITRTRGYNTYSAMQAIYGSSYRYEPPAEIATDTITTDSQGNYTIKFKAVSADEEAAKHGLTYRYEINADVTDASGETHSGSTSVNVGKKDMVINANVPAYLFVKDTAKIGIRLSTLNGQKLKGSLNIKVYALQGPGRVFKSRLWNKPDQYILSKSDYELFFPGYTYHNEDLYTSWAVKQKVTEITDTTNMVKETVVDLNAIRQQKSGIYKIIITAVSAKGETDSLIKYVNFVNQPSAPQNMSDWVVPVVNSVIPGGAAEFLVGTGQQTHVLMERYRNEKLISSKWLELSNSQQDFKIPVANGDEDNAVIQFMMVYQNRIYTSYQHIYVSKPDKTLNLKMLTFRNLLQPGQKEQWKLQVSGYKNEKVTAELVAGLYDASLDAITPPENWDNINLSNNRGYNYFNWNAYNFVSQQQSAPLFYKYVSYPSFFHNYETLDMFGYSYYGGYNYSYNQYLDRVQAKQKLAANDKQLDDNYRKNAALVKKGYDISGHVVDENGGSLPGVSVKIFGSSIGTVTNSEGYFKLKVPVNGTLTFAHIGYLSQKMSTNKADKITISLKESDRNLAEVSIVGYGTQTKSGLPGSSSTVMIRGNNTIYGSRVPDEQMLNGLSAGVEIVNEKSYIGANVAHATQNLPADILESIQVVDGDQEARTGKSITPRTNFAETAFFYPQLHTDENGQILIDFTIPESLTKWRFRGFAHTKDLKTGYIEKEIVTQKQLSVSANMPRFLREGDTLIVSARLSNLTVASLKGTVKLQLFNAINMQPVSLLLNAKEALQSFELASATNKVVSFKLFIPAGLDALTYRITAESGNYSDGEENTLPVLPNRMLVTESLPMMVRADQTKDFTFDKLVNEQSKTLINKTLTLEYTQNPAWYAVQALPYMMEFPYECSEQVFSRYYANSLATNLVNKMPIIKKVFDEWKAVNSTELVSNLEKNPVLKATLLEETPWLRDAQNETEQKKRIALLFDLNKMSYELKQNLDKLKDRQLSDGGFPWFGGDRSDAYITRYILAGIGQLYHSGVVSLADMEMKGIADKAMGYLDKVIIDDANRAKQNKDYDTRSLGSTEIHAWYTESYFVSRKRSVEIQALLDNYLKLAEKQWVSQGVYEQGLIALTMLRNKKPEVAQRIIKSLLETAQQTYDMGMYWAKNQLGYYWYQSPVETQSLMIELFTEAGNQAKAVDEMKIWLMRNKQTNNWKTTKATAQACYALLMKGDSLLSSAGTSVIKLNGKSLTDLKPDVKADAGTGYLKTTWVDEQVKPELGKIEIANKGKSISWGSMSWQYTENLDKITPSNTDIKLERKYFIQKQTDAGPVLTAVDAKHKPKTGDLLKVVVYLKSGRDFEYVHLKDMRPAGTEPVDVLSAYKFQDGLAYYEVTKDVATNFFISQLNKGNYVFEYKLRVVQPGNYSTGISTIQCMYAPEFNAHSEGRRLVIEK